MAVTSHIVLKGLCSKFKENIIKRKFNKFDGCFQYFYSWHALDNFFVREINFTVDYSLCRTIT